MSSSAVSYLQPDLAYRKEPSHAQSLVKHILKSPAHYQAAKARKFAPTLTMQIGSALHCLALEGGEQFERDFILKPEGLSLATKEGKAWKEENKSKTVLSKSDQYQSWDAVHGMTESLRRLEWFDPSQEDYRKFNEVSLYWDADGLPCKCRLDRLLLGDSSAVILDLKTTDSIEPSQFLKKIVGDLNYLFQAAWYIDGVQQVFGVPATFVFIGIERAAPYVMGIFEVSADMALEGFAQIGYARALLKECERSKIWAPPAIEHHVLQLPSWYRSPLVDATVGEDDAALDAAFSDF